MWLVCSVVVVGMLCSVGETRLPSTTKCKHRKREAQGGVIVPGVHTHLNMCTEACPSSNYSLCVTHRVEAAHVRAEMWSC